jgi:hypothetical protein
VPDDELAHQRPLVHARSSLILMSLCICILMREEADKLASQYRCPSNDQYLGTPLIWWPDQQAVVIPFGELDEVVVIAALRMVL